MFFVGVVFLGFLCGYYFALEELDTSKHVALRSPNDATIYTLTRAYVSVPIVALGVCMKVFLKYASADPIGEKYVQAASASMLSMLVLSEFTALAHDNGHGFASYFGKIFGNAGSNKVATRLAVLWCFKLVVIVIVACFPAFGDVSALNCAYGSIVLMALAWAGAYAQNSDGFDVNEIK